MKKIVLLLFVIITIKPFLFSQVIKGTVFEYNTHTPVRYATVYFNGTFIGTSSDRQGNFKLNSIKDIPLTVSAIGYYSVTISDFSKNKPLVIYLKPKIYELEDVVIQSKSLARKRRRYLRLFKEEFIGTTNNAEECEILNEKDITFNYDSDDDTIKAYALKPILIKNNALGYKITYYLDKFEYYKNTRATFFSGNFIFTQDLTNDNTKPQLYYQQRKKTYQGSRMHFIRVLSTGNLKKSAFIVKDTKNKRLKINDLVYIDNKSNTFLRNKGKIIIEYKNPKHFYDYTIRKSGLEFFDDLIYFDESGFFNPGLKWNGDMGQQRMADWLPYEYTLDRVE